MTEIRETIELFIASWTEPALAGAGEELIRISRDNFSLDTSHGALRLRAWNDRRNLVRRITGIDEESRGKLVLSIGHFGKRPGTLSLVDLRRPSGQDATLKSERLEFREQFRLFLRRQFPTHHNPGLTTEPDLEPSLSPAYPRALLRKGSQCWASHRRFVGSISLRTRADLRPHLARLTTGQGTGPGDSRPDDFIFPPARESSPACACHFSIRTPRSRRCSSTMTKATMRKPT